MNVATLVGVYAIPAAHVHVTCVLANVNPTAPYRGAGRPESTYVIERLIDDAAREVGLDRVALRREPHPGVGDAAPDGVQGHLRQRPVREGDGQGPRTGGRRGLPGAPAGLTPAREAACLSVVNAIERAASPQPSSPSIRFDPSGGATVLMGTKSQGQGHETAFKQVLHERLGLDPRRGPLCRRRHRPGRVRYGHLRLPVRGDRRLGVVACRRQGHRQGPANRPRTSWRPRRRTSCSPTPASGVTGTIDRDAVRGRPRGVPAHPIAGRPGTGLYETGTFVPKHDTWPNGCHVCEVEIDPDTGVVTLVDYVVVDDAGTVDQSPDARRSDSRRHRARRGAGPHGGGGL